jgi:outer membrane protein assembly factor BamB
MSRMATTHFDEPLPQKIDQPKSRKPLRLWPGVGALVLQWIGWFAVPFFFPEIAMYGAFAGIIAGLIIVLWWLFFSRAPWLERIGALVVIVVAVIAAKRVVHPSISNGMMGNMLYVVSIPYMGLALVGWALITRRFSTGMRRLAFVAALVLALVPLNVMRTSGVSGEGISDLHWRWSKTPEERLLEQAGNEPSAPANVAAETGSDKSVGGLEWSGFRGSNRDGVVRGVRIDTNWSQKPPAQLWRQPVGPAWSSFAVHDNLLYTQEQRGESEMVSCYNLTTGQSIWKHADAARFWESNAGAGPRGTPTLHNGRVYTLGGTGILNALDAATGAVVWSRNAATDTKAKLPMWGFAGSPLVVGDVVIVATAGALAGYDIATGKPRWVNPGGGGGYSSPHLAKIGGVEQVLLLNGEGAISVTPADGKLLWKHSWKGDAIVQPAVTAEGDVLVGSGSGFGTEIGLLRVAVEQGSGGWTTKERWIAIGLKPYFNDFVLHKDYAFGFDGPILSCVDLKTGDQKWEGVSYGHGQLILLADQDLLLVLSEKGDLALVKATPDQFAELGRFKVIEGKTWNHPVVVGDILLVRNSEEMAAYRLTRASP